MALTLGKVLSLVEGKPISKQVDLDLEIQMGCGADLMSDVLSYIKSGALLLTGLTNSQVVRTAEIAEIVAICFVRGKRPTDEMVELAKEKDIPLLCTSMLMYESCGCLYGQDLPGCSKTEKE